MACLGLLLFATACDTNNNLNNCDYDESALLTNYADEIIIPRFEDFKTGLTLLDGSVNAFAANPTIGLLNEIKVTFAVAYPSYERCGTFAFGPGLIDGVPFRERFNTFPTNTIGIEDNIVSGTDVANCAKSTVGFPALEYLIFGDGTQTDQQIVDMFSSGANASNRIAYLQGLSTELKGTTTQIVQDWDGYRSSFVANTGISTGSSISLLVNEFNYDFEILKNFKFKIPLGKLNGGVVLPQNVEAYYAGGSVLLAKEQVSAFKDLYLGVGENQSDGEGLYEYLVCLNTESGDQLLADDITDQFNEILAKLDAIPNPMSETLVSNKPVVDAAYTEMQMMVPKIKYDMTSALGVQISYQDNDGD